MRSNRVSSAACKRSPRQSHNQPKVAVFLSLFENLPCQLQFSVHRSQFPLLFLSFLLALWFPAGNWDLLGLLFHSFTSSHHLDFCYSRNHQTIHWARMYLNWWLYKIRTHTPTNPKLLPSVLSLEMGCFSCFGSRHEEKKVTPGGRIVDRKQIHLTIPSDIAKLPSGKIFCFCSLLPWSVSVEFLIVAWSIMLWIPNRLFVLPNFGTWSRPQ